MRMHALALLAPLFATGCALTTKSEPLGVHYLTPLSGAAHDREAAAPSAMPEVPLGLRLRGVDTALHIDERIVVRDGLHRLRFLETYRWTERPRVYVEQKVSAALFRDGVLRRIVSGPGATLEVSVEAFELVSSPEPTARVALRFLLHDERHAIREGRIEIERPYEGEPDQPGGADAAALGAALDQAVQRVATEVLAELTARRAETQAGATAVRCVD